MTSPFAPAHPNVVRYNCDKLHPNGVWERDVLGIYSVYQKGRTKIVVYRWDIYPYSLLQRCRSATIPEHVGEVSNPASLCGSEIVRHEPNGDVSQLLANAKSGRQSMCGNSPKQERSDLGQPAFCGEDVADAECSERWPVTERRDDSNRSDPRRKEAPSRFRAGSQNVADTSSSGFEIRTEIQARQPAVESGSETVGDSEEFPIRPGLRETESGSHRQRRSANPSPWPVEPNVGRVAHGVPKRVDRLAALGDAIVPACVEEVIRRALLMS